MIAIQYYTTTTEFNCGIDLHTRQMYACVMDRDDKKLVHTNIKNSDFDRFLKLVAPYRHDLTVCAECMFGWYWLANARRSVLGTAGLRGLDWARLPAATSPVIRPPGRETWARGRPGSFYRVNHIPGQRKKNLAIPPHPQVRKKLEPRLDRGSRLRIEWIANG